MLRASATLLTETERLRLRPVRAADAAPTAELVTKDVSDNLLTWKWPMSPDEVAARIRRAEADLRGCKAVNLAIVERDTETLIGWMGFALQPERRMRLGYWLGERYRNRGLTTEAVRAAIPAAAEYLGVDEVVAEAFAHNRPSIAVLEALGFRRLGSCEIVVPRTGRAEAGLRYALPVISGSLAER